MTGNHPDTPATVRRRPLVGALLPAVLIVAYAFWPGDQSGLLQGPPWQAAGGLVTIVVLAGVLLACAFRSRPAPSWVSPLLVALIAGRVLLSSALIPQGWSSSFVLDQNGVRQRIERIGRHADDGGIVDRWLDLSERSPAFQFLNDGVISP